MIQRIFSYLSYLAKSFHLHGIHSPSVFDLQQNIIKAKEAYYAFDEIEAIRAKLLLTEKLIEVEDLGAGAKLGYKKERSIKSITQSACKSPKYAQLLFRLTYHRKPNSILELGTSIGLTTAYLAKAAPQAKVISIEGSEQIAKIAQLNLEKLNVHNVKQLIGDFASELSGALTKLHKVDMVFFDGNHQKAPTLAYFEACLEYATEDSIFIFDDIYWSTEMSQAWRKIKEHDQVRQTIDLFQMGIVFFKTDQEQEHFTIYH